MVYQKLTPPSSFKSMGFVTYSKLLKCLVKLESYPRFEEVCSIEDIPLTWDTLEIKAVHLSPQSSPGPLHYQTGPAKHLVDLAPDIFGRCLCWCWWVVVVLLVGSYCGAGVGAPSSASPAVGAAGLVSDRGPSNGNTVWWYQFLCPAIPLASPDNAAIVMRVGAFRTFHRRDWNLKIVEFIPHLLESMQKGSWKTNLWILEFKVFYEKQKIVVQSTFMQKVPVLRNLQNKKKHIFSTTKQLWTV